MRGPCSNLQADEIGPLQWIQIVVWIIIYLNVFLLKPIFFNHWLNNLFENQKRKKVNNIALKMILTFSKMLPRNLKTLSNQFLSLSFWKLITKTFLLAAGYFNNNLHQPPLPLLLVEETDNEVHIHKCQMTTNYPMSMTTSADIP